MPKDFTNFIETSFQLMRHRGPDNDGFVDLGEVGIGHQRLSILDTSSQANQPMNEGHYYLAFNGEIYNYKELREQYLDSKSLRTTSDTEVLLKLLSQKGLNILHELNGMWAFALYNRHTKELLLCRDRFGVKPLYYLMQDDVLYFSSEMKPLIQIKKHLVQNKQLYQNFVNHLATDYNESTFIEGIFQVEKGQYIGYSKTDHSTSGLQKVTWYKGADFAFDESLFKDKEKTIAFTEDLLLDAIRIRLRSDVPLCITLSGGLDSTVIYTLIKERLHHSIQPFTFVHPEAPTSELDKVMKLTKAYNDEVSTVRLENYDNYADIEHVKQCLQSLEFPSWGVSILAYRETYREIAKRGYRVVIEGHGSDEQLGGYPYMVHAAFEEVLSQRKIAAMASLLKIMYQTQNQNLNQRNATSLLTMATRAYGKVFLSYFLSTYAKKLENQRENHRFQASLDDAFTFKILPIVLRTFDRLTMASSLESRSPFMDYRIVEFFKKMPLGYKVNAMGSKAILRDILKNYKKDFLYKDKSKMGFSLDEPRFYNHPKNREFITTIIKSAELAEFPQLKANALMNVQSLPITWDKVDEIWKAFSLALVEQSYFKVKVNIKASET